MDNKFRDFLKKYTYAGLIAVIVITALIFLPMFNTDGKIYLAFPETPFGWVAYIVIRVLVRCYGIYNLCII